MHTFAKRLAIVFGLAAILPIGGWWLAPETVGLFWEGCTHPQWWQLWTRRNWSYRQPLFWTYFALVAIAVFAVAFKAAYGRKWIVKNSRSKPFLNPVALRKFYRSKHAERNQNWKSDAVTEGRIVMLVSAVLVIGFAVQVFAIPHNNVDTAVHYNKATEFIVEDINNVPDSLDRLVDGAKPGTGDRSACYLVGRYNIPSCIKEGSYPSAGWEPRTASWAAAERQLTKSSVGTSKTQLRTYTMTYIHPEEGEGYWTGVRDGSGKQTPAQSLYSIVEWSGKPGELPVECKFEGNYEINRALEGRQMNDLRNLIAEKYPQYPYLNSDVHGYCDRENPYNSETHPNGAPVLIILTYQEVRAGNHVGRVPGVLLEIRGSDEASGGDPVIIPHYSVKPEDGILGPVYPLSIAAAQRDQVRWASGRYAHKNGFGYEHLTAASQDGNTSEYFLRQADTGRTAWVSPLSLRNNNSQMTVVDTVISADHMVAGELNTLKVHVFDEDDPRRVDINRMTERIKSRLIDPDMLPTFTGEGGTIEEFTRTTGHGWRAFGMIDGTLKFLADFDNDGGLTITVFDDEGQPDFTDTEIAASDELCSKPVTDLTAEEFAVCLKAA